VCDHDSVTAANNQGQGGADLASPIVNRLRPPALKALFVLNALPHRCRHSIVWTAKMRWGFVSLSLTLNPTPYWSRAGRVLWKERHFRVICSFPNLYSSYVDIKDNTTSLP